MATASRAQMPAPDDDLETRARAFARAYATLFSLPDASDPARIDALAARIAAFYRPGLTVFTEGKIQRFETRAAAATLIAHEMHNNAASGLGTKLLLQEVVKVEAYAPSSALVWLQWRFEPAAGSEFAGRGWAMVNVYGFRAAAGGGIGEDGWEFVLRDQEVMGVRSVTGGTFE